MATTRHHPAAPNSARVTTAGTVISVNGSSITAKPGPDATNSSAPIQAAGTAARRIAVRKRSSPASAQPARKNSRYDQRCQPA
ncbi:hypothetical protein SFUMM280S_07499 [Streptomyces fumanus]